MNGLRAELDEVAVIAANHRAPGRDPNCDVVLCPPATLIREMAELCTGTGITVGAQDCDQNAHGAHTGDISAKMLADAGARYCIIGHSERRQTHHETDDMVRAKALAAWGAGLRAIICVGETLDQRQAANTLGIIGDQLAASVPDAATGETLVVAYEPIWAIGTGQTPTLADIAEVHGFMRAGLAARFGIGVAQSVRLLYGGSMNPGNAAEIIRVADVDGGLVGGASLKARDFCAIISAIDA